MPTNDRVETSQLQAGWRMLTNDWVCGRRCSAAECTYTPRTTGNLNPTKTPLTAEVFWQKARW